MKQILWAILAWIVSRRPIAALIIRIAKRTPYTHITGRNDTDVYMRRWWLFNPHSRDAAGAKQPPRWPWLPSIRVHEILRPDDDKHLHDHPFDARTIVLKGWYAEERESDPHVECYRERGYTGPITVGMFHRITDVSREGEYDTPDWDVMEVCTTLFITFGQEAEDWGFKVAGRKVPWQEYLYSPNYRCQRKLGKTCDWADAPTGPGSVCRTCGETCPF